MIYCNGRPGGDVKAFVMDCERDFEAKLDSAVREIVDQPELKVIGLSGPSCSGKTTAARKLELEFEARGRNVHVVSIDNFFKDRKDLFDPNGDFDFDSIAALDFPIFEKCVADISGGRVARIPYYDFVSGKKTTYTEIVPDSRDLFVFEGIQAVYPEVKALLHEFHSRSVYISVERGIEYGPMKFDPKRIRLLRRIVRDNNFRGTNANDTLSIWKKVRANEEENILPYADGCDIRIDSTMPYEIGLLKGYLSPLLENTVFGDDNAVIAGEIASLIKDVEVIPGEYIPEGSIYYEFIKKQ